jgi:hypothetical protein
LKLESLCNIETEELTIEFAEWLEHDKLNTDFSTKELQLKDRYEIFKRERVYEKRAGIS